MSQNGTAADAETTEDPDGGLLSILSGLQQSEAVKLPVSYLRGTISPRLAGENEAHSRALAEMDELPPILVDKQTMRVVDGVHRVRAAVLRGQTTIDAIFTEGPADDLFLLAVTLNTRHGLPLSLADRKAAALRIVGCHPNWSDHAIAAAAGLAATTVGGIRRQCSSGASVQSNTRLGRDGRVRPIDGTAGRRRAVDEGLARPGASIREIAKAAGVSLGTAHAVTRLVRGSPGGAAAAAAALAARPVRRTRRGPGPAGTPAPGLTAPGLTAPGTAAPGPYAPPKSAPGLTAPGLTAPGLTAAGTSAPGLTAAGTSARGLTAPERPAEAGAEPRPGQAGDAAGWAAIRESMRRDPTVRYSESGRLFFRWLEGHVMVRQEWAGLLEAVPPHRTRAIATLARSCARQWLDLVAELERQEQSNN